MVKVQKKKRGAKKGSTHTVGIKLSELKKICETITDIDDGGEDVIVHVGRKWIDGCASAIGHRWISERASCDQPDNLKGYLNKSADKGIVFKVYNDGI